MDLMETYSMVSILYETQNLTYWWLLYGYLVLYI